MDNDIALTSEFEIGFQLYRFTYIQDDDYKTVVLQVLDSFYDFATGNLVRKWKNLDGRDGYVFAPQSLKIIGKYMLMASEKLESMGLDVPVL